MNDLIGKGGGGGGWRGGWGGGWGPGWGYGPGWWGQDVELVDVPVPMAECAAYDAYGNCILPTTELIGLADLGVITRNLNSLKPVTNEIARLMLRGGMEAIEGAIAGAKQPWYKPNLAGPTERSAVLGKLNWHAAHLAQAPGGANALYDAPDDLKKWVIAAYVDANAVEIGAVYLDASWERMWSEIQRNLAAIPGETLKVLTDAAGKVGGAVFGVPPWAFWVGGALAVGLVGWGAWKLANSGAGQAAIRGYSGGLVGRRG